MVCLIQFMICAALWPMEWPISLRFRPDIGKVYCSRHRGWMAFNS